ncbi:MAG TPA: ribbon-helix-helix domain-containing protein [Candidatus Polarisedimenticolaceae bacterium]|nr:ribbon-helix-helix domain-containing protein [Candidatus Polarisedimenticolaceae bacterium]
MRTVQMTLDDALVRDVDRAAKRLGTTRSAFTRDALRSALKQVKIREMEAKHREGYARNPYSSRDIAVWEPEQVWPDDD